MSHCILIPLGQELLSLLQQPEDDAEVRTLGSVPCRKFTFILFLFFLVCKYVPPLWSIRHEVRGWLLNESVARASSPAPEMHRKALFAPSQHERRESWSVAQCLCKKRIKKL